jgi:iron complex transport system permease protein
MREHKGIILASALLVVTASVLAITFGRYRIDLSTLGQIVASSLSTGETRQNLVTPALVLWSVRLPRVIMAVMVGAALSVAGAVFQGLFRNPLVSPGILGVTHGSAFGAALAILLAGHSAVAIESSAFFWGLGAAILAYQLARSSGNTATSLVLSGVIISALFMAAVSFVKYKADPYQQLPAIVFWTMGSLNSVVWRDTVRTTVLIVLGIGTIYSLRWWLNPMALGDEDAMALGIDVPKARVIYILIATLIVAAPTAYCGNIQWVGPIVPHMARTIVGSDHDALIPFSALLGGLFMLVMDTIARVLPGGEVPVGILTALLGAPFFAYLLIKGGKGAWQA